MVPARQEMRVVVQLTFDGLNLWSGLALCHRSRPQLRIAAACLGMKPLALGFFGGLCPYRAGEYPGFGWLPDRDYFFFFRGVLRR
jgi:hypothetical protein